MDKKILVVEDDSDTREMLQAILGLESFAVVTAEDGRAGLDKAQADHPDLIITDIQMPRLDGIGLIRHLRADAEFRQVPIITITAYGRDLQQQALSAWADCLVAKPIDLEVLLGHITNLLLA